MKPAAAITLLMLLSSAIHAAPPTFSTKRLVNTPVNGLLPFDVRTEDIDRDAGDGVLLPHPGVERLRDRTLWCGLDGRSAHHRGVSMTEG